MKLLLLTRHAIGLNILKHIFTAYPEDLAAVVTTAEDEIHAFAAQYDIPTHIFMNSPALVEFLEKEKIAPDLGAMVWWPTIIKEPLISFPKQGFINTHPAFLPYCRGSMSNFWALVEDVPFGVSIHKVDSKVDHGDVLAQARIDVDWTDTDETLYHKSLLELESLFKTIYPRIRNGDLFAVPQKLENGSYHRLAELSDATRLNLNAPNSARKLLNLLRARSFNGSDGCWFEENGERYEVRISITKKQPSAAIDGEGKI